MGRLIDDNLLKKGIKKWLKPSKPDEDEYISITDALVSTLQEIEAQPTAYDPDKVVEQLEERTAFLKDCTKYGNKTAEQQSKSYDTMMMYEVNDLVDDLLEIVKAGGADG